MALMGALLVTCGSPATALADDVVVLGADGNAAVRNDRFLTTPALTATPRPVPSARTARLKRGPTNHVTVPIQLSRLLRSHQIDQADYRRYGASFRAAQTTRKHVSGTRGFELGAVISNLQAMAAAGSLTPSRLTVLFLTLDRNRQWWTTGPLLSYAQRVEFAGSELVWEYYPGQGIELQELGSFGKANGFYGAGPAYYAQGRELVDELTPLAAQRAGGLTWEYYFEFDGGVPPWTSAMSQGTALQALARTFTAFDDTAYLTIAQHALPVLSAAPPAGVSVKTRLGRRYLLYSFAPGAAIINGFLQTLIGLYTYAQASGNATAARLFAAGDAEARAEVPRYDTGAWSLYETGDEDTLDYHNLVTGFLGQLCSITQAPVYCTTAAHFQLYLKSPPGLRLLTGRVRAGTASVLRFQLSKFSHVGITLLRNGQTVFLTSARFGYGTDAFRIPALSRPGSYTVRLAATDLAGNFNRITGILQVSR